MIILFLIGQFSLSAFITYALVSYTTQWYRLYVLEWIQMHFPCICLHRCIICAKNMIMTSCSYNVFSDHLSIRPNLKALYNRDRRFYPWDPDNDATVYYSYLLSRGDIQEADTIHEVYDSDYDMEIPDSP